MDHSQIYDAELESHLVEEPRLLAVRVNQLHVKVRARHGKRHAGQAGTGTDVEQAPPPYMRQGTQAVDEVALHQLAAIPNRGQIEHPVPLVEQREIPDEGVGLGSRERHAQPRHSIGELLSPQRLHVRFSGRPLRDGVTGFRGHAPGSAQPIAFTISP